MRRMLLRMNHDRDIIMIELINMAFPYQSSPHLLPRSPGKMAAAPSSTVRYRARSGGAGGGRNRLVPVALYPSCSDLGGFSGSPVSTNAGSPRLSRSRRSRLWKIPQHLEQYNLPGTFSSTMWRTTWSPGWPTQSSCIPLSELAFPLKREVAQLRTWSAPAIVQCGCTAAPLPMAFE